MNPLPTRTSPLTTFARLVCSLSFALGFAGLSGCELIPFCAVAGHEDRCMAGDETGGSETATGDGDGDGDDDGGFEPPKDLSLSYSQVKQFDFAWTPGAGNQFYRLLEREDANTNTDYEEVAALGADSRATMVSLAVPLLRRREASYILRACNIDFGCVESTPVAVTGSLADAVGYFKASNTNASDELGWRVALSADGDTLAVGARFEDGGAVGVNGDQADNSGANAGAVYVYARGEQGVWTQQAYVKPSNTDAADQFGYSVALSADGRTLAVGARYEASGATGIDGDQADNSATYAGAVYLFTRDEQGAWTQAAYVKASNAATNDYFGWSVALSQDGGTLAVGALGEDSSATGPNGDQQDELAPGSGAVYVYARDALGEWAQTAYLKASNTQADDSFGWSVALSQDGGTLAVGARDEASSATGIGGDEANNSAFSAGAVYLYGRDPQWTQQAYFKASNTGAGDYFGWSVALSADGGTLAVGATGEGSSAAGLDGDESDDTAPDAGAVYLYARGLLGEWTQEAYVKASNPGANDKFGYSVALSADGGVLAVGAFGEDSGARGLDGDQASEAIADAGAVYVYARDPLGVRSQDAYVKAPNPGLSDFFGWSVALSQDGRSLAIGAPGEDSSATGIGRNQADNSGFGAGAVYLY